MPNFAQVVAHVFNGWTVLKLAVEHGFGGADSASKADWMVTAVDQWFSENDDLEPYEVEEFLAQILDTEFNTVAEDGSLIQISKILCRSYKLLQKHDNEELERYLALLPQKAASGQSVMPTSECKEQDEVEEMDTEDCCECSSNSEKRDTNEECNKNESSPSGEPGENRSSSEPTDVEDGWTVVRKGKKR